ncbi:coiled-coil domain-containing protein [Duganella qianjiadongensis]|uniref:DUF1640 domain-containing protein n=1 Tax=Duganella qianjiadongensis TaxID=2692176 RepID=A0ABW9VPZ2_9BURK|nr:coiled-coil domain-containing protein [Duganella qianjiadongensis]MYM41639.1 DUF1640 domain-containing protein [Duganella qianjiadongensis]
MDEQISKLDKRLTSVENEVESLRQERQEMRRYFASKEDILRMESRIALLFEQSASKTELRALERQQAEEFATLNQRSSEFEKRISNDLGEMRLQMAHLELRILRWLIGTVLTMASIIVAVVKFWV